MPEFKRRIGYHVELVGCFTKITSSTNIRKSIYCKIYGAFHGENKRNKSKD